jgi:putative transport protein
MSWLWDLARTQPIAHAVLILSLVAASGMALGSVKVRGIGLGTAGVLFAGILFGHFGQKIDHAVLDFVKEFGLVLFVFTIGLQLGPGFFAALREHGMRLNALAASIVALGALTAVLAGRLLGIDVVASLGLFSGATTNTPSLGAAQQALAILPGVPPERAALAALAYAVAYPAGIAGIIASLLALRAIFRIDATAEAAQLRAEQQRGIEPLERMTLLVENANLDGLQLAEIPGRNETGVVLARIRPAGATAVQTATEGTVLHVCDHLLAVATRDGLDRFARIVGRPVDLDLLGATEPITSRRVVVTRREALGRSINDLALDPLFNVNPTRVTRADVEMAATPHLRLQFGDVVRLVGEPDDIDRAADVLGNSPKALNETQFIPLFTGIALGILAGVLPISIPGLPVPIRLGLAGGPLLLAIALSRVGYIGRLVWYMPINANLAFRELGITLFLACVGLKAGERFFATVFTEVGLLWLLCALVVAMLPLLAVGVFARRVLGMNFATISGLIAGSTTDPPALAFASALAESDAPNLAYATVYPMTMLLRILTAQVLALFLCG